MCKDRKLHFDPQGVSNVILSKHPGVRLCCGANMAVTAATSFVLKRTSGWGTYFKKHIFTAGAAEQLTKRVTIFRL